MPSKIEDHQKLLNEVFAACLLCSQSNGSPLECLRLMEDFLFPTLSCAAVLMGLLLLEWELLAERRHCKQLLFYLVWRNKTPGLALNKASWTAITNGIRDCFCLPS